MQLGNWEIGKRRNGEMGNWGNWEKKDSNNKSKNKINDKMIGWMAHSPFPRAPISRISPRPIFVAYFLFPQSCLYVCMYACISSPLTPARYKI